MKARLIAKRAGEAQLRDVLVINTCAVTEESVRQARQAIRKAKRENPTRRIIVTGCAAQIAPENYAAMPEVDQVLGNQEKLTAGAYADFGMGAAEKIRVNIMSLRQTAPQMWTISMARPAPSASAEWLRSSLHLLRHSVWARQLRSVPMGAVVRPRRLVEKGFAEIVLQRGDLTSYGRPAGRPSWGAGGENPQPCAELKRLRLSSLDAIEADPVLMRIIAEEERLMPHFISRPNRVTI
jgi:threonylcarbamoyladenosine tRNA methylthiotransferase MtaB